MKKETVMSRTVKEAAWFFALFLVFCQLFGCASIPDAWNPWDKSPCAYLYSDWGTCAADGKQTRTVTASTPEGCKGTPVLEQVCETPPEPPTSESADAIDPSTVIWDTAANPAGWNITAKLGKVTITSDGLQAESLTGTDNWKRRNDGGEKPTIGNWVLIRKCADGQWHGSTIEWLGPGKRRVTGKHWTPGTDDIKGCVGNDPYPASGEQVYVMVSGCIRGGQGCGTERSQAVGALWP